FFREPSIHQIRRAFQPPGRAEAGIHTAGILSLSAALLSSSADRPSAESPVTQRMRPLGGFSGQILNYYGFVRWVHLHPAWPAAVDCRSGYLKLSYFGSRHSTAAAIRWSVRNPTYQEAPAAAATNSRYTAASG